MQVYLRSLAMEGKEDSGRSGCFLCKIFVSVKNSLNFAFEHLRILKELF